MREINFKIVVECTEENAESFALSYPHMMVPLTRAFEALLELSLDAGHDDLQVTHMEANLLRGKAKSVDV